MNPKTKEILKAVAFIVIPFASVAAVIAYGPKVVKWYQERKQLKENTNKEG